MDELYHTNISVTEFRPYGQSGQKNRKGLSRGGRINRVFDQKIRRGMRYPNLGREKKKFSDTKPAFKTSHTFLIQPLDTDERKFSHKDL
jgi:hypothetical protein